MKNLENTRFLTGPFFETSTHRPNRNLKQKLVAKISYTRFLSVNYQEQTFFFSRKYYEARLEDAHGLFRNTPTHHVQKSQKTSAFSGSHLRASVSRPVPYDVQYFAQV